MRLLRAVFLVVVGVAGMKAIEYTEPPIAFFDGMDTENKCMSRLERRIEGKNGILVSHSHYDLAVYNGSRNCFIMLAAPIGYRIRLRIIKFHVNGHLGNCEKDTLHVFDHDTPIDPKQPHRPTDEAVIPGPMLGQWCGKVTNTSELVVSRLNAMTLWWHTDKDLPRHHNGHGFKLLWSAFRKEMSAPCAVPLEFACGNRECIPAEIACNSYADCSDDSDLIPERQLDNKCDRVYSDPSRQVTGTHVMFIVAAVCALSFLLCVIVCVCTPCMDATKYEDQSRQSRPFDESPRKEYTPGTEETASSREPRYGAQPLPPAFYPPSPPSRARPTVQQRDMRRLHHSAHQPLHTGLPTSAPTHYYHKFVQASYAPSDLSSVRFPAPPPTVADSDYTYVRPIVDSHIL